ncbi:M14 family metallopeptidase [Aliikangiella sp. IMCC44653]
MNRRIIVLVAVSMQLFLASLVDAKTELAYYLPHSAQYDAKITLPETVLGYQVGDWHVRPEQIQQYMQRLAQESSRVKVEITGYTHEHRPLMLVYISSPENIKNLESIRQRHLEREPSASSPIVTWMGYSVHGNEASGSNASLLFAYHLAAAQDKKTLAQLNNQVIIIDPMLNPDGLARFAHWTNMYKSQNPNPDPLDAEHNESWPYGRTNHYWFDLNRDWLLLQHPESVARVTQFHRWRPHVLTDFHEMGTNSSYFFQPGVHSRQNPLTPEANFKMTATIAQYHAKALDDIGSLYYSQENFDDFYYGKGSTYPDAHGSVGILFEQASARGHLQASQYGEISFPFAIRNHLTTSFSTLEAAQQNAANLKKMRKAFVESTQKLAKKDRNRAIVFKSQDAYRLNEIKRILQTHQILFYSLAEKIKVGQREYQPNQAVIIPLMQPQYRLIRSLFETRKQFKDQVFYDVSAWNMGMAFDLDFDWVSRSDYATSLLGQELNKNQPNLPSYDTQKLAASVALAFDWQDFSSNILLVRLQQKGLRVQGVTKSTRLLSAGAPVDLNLGSIILPLKGQAMSAVKIVEWLQPQLNALQLEVTPINSGLAVSGVDLGSPSLPVLEKINPAIIIDESVSSYDAGEAWHFLDQRLEQRVTLLTLEKLKKLQTIPYTHLIFVHGKYTLEEAASQELKRWLKQGGVLITHSGASQWVVEQGWLSSEIKEFEPNKPTNISYANKQQADAKHVVGGAIANVKVDITHPLAFGLSDENIAIFKRRENALTEPKEPYVAIARFTSAPHAAGYMSDEVEAHLVNQVSIAVQGVGQGKVIAFSDNPLFRGFWLGTSRMFANALYFGKVIKASPKAESDEQKPTKSAD